MDENTRKSKVTKAMVLLHGRHGFSVRFLFFSFFCSIFLIFFTIVALLLVLAADHMEKVKRGNELREKEIAQEKEKIAQLNAQIR